VLCEDAEAGEGYVCIRGEDVTLEKGTIRASSARHRLSGQVRALGREGPLVRVSVDCGFALTALITYQACLELELREGDAVTALVKASALHLVPRG
jgi:molybdate transport system ATP-binding protein